MRYLFVLFCSFILIPFSRVSAQNSAPKQIRAGNFMVISAKTRDSLRLARFKKRRHLDSVKRIHLRDSLRAGFTIFFKGHSYSAKQISGRRFIDSLDHPYKFLKSKIRLTRLDSVKLKIKSLTDQSLNKASDSLKINVRRQIGSTVSTALDSVDGKRTSIQAHSDTLANRSEVFEPVINNSIPSMLQPLSAVDSGANINARFTAYIQKHYKLDSLRQRLAEIYPAMQATEIIDPHRPLAKPGINRNVRETWIVFILLLMVTLVTLVKVRFPKDLGDIVESLFNDRMIKSNRDASLIYSPSFIFMFLCFCLTAALAIYEYIHFQHLSSDYKGPALYCIMVACILGFLLCKLIIYRISAAVFNIDRMVQPYLSFQYITIANFNLFCIPFLIVFSLYNAVLLPHLVVWIPFIFLAFLLFMYIRSIVFFISNFELPKFYLFLYFCTLEVCPLIIVFKLING